MVKNPCNLESTCYSDSIHKQRQKVSIMNNHDYGFVQVLEAALWSSVDDNGEPLDLNFDIRDIDQDSRELIKTLYLKFVEKANILLVRSGLSYSDVAHNYWFTSQGHGVGFWDLGLGKTGDELTELCEQFSPNGLYVGDDGLIYN